MTRYDHLMVELFFAALIVLLIVVLYYTDRRFTRERIRNAKLRDRITNLQKVVRIQDHVIVSKIEVVLEEHRASTAAVVIDEVVTHPLLNVDQVIMAMEYCYECHGLKGPTHFRQTNHRMTPAPELTGP